MPTFKVTLLLLLVGLLVIPASDNSPASATLFALGFSQGRGQLASGPTLPEGELYKRNRNRENDLDKGKIPENTEPTNYLPIVLKPPTCQLSKQEQQIFNLAASHPEQNRPVTECRPILAQVARARALDMGNRDYFSHVNPDGYGPNYLVRRAGYSLPSWWGTDPALNYIESIAGGFSTAESAWDAWLNSPGHRRHVLGENDFWAEQTNIGIGYAFVSNSEYKHYWVFISAPPES